jgi:hypothetical protein
MNDGERKIVAKFPFFFSGRNFGLLSLEKAPNRPKLTAAHCIKRWLSYSIFFIGRPCTYVI